VAIFERPQLPDNKNRLRVNRMIRFSPVRVISPEGDQLGIMAVDEAIAAAEARGLDLVEVAPAARPPVCRIMDFGKFKFDDHDFDFKTRHAREFLAEGNKVKVTMMFRGRQMAHPELGKAVLDRVAEVLGDIGKIEQDARLEGKNMTMLMTPK
jgi:translation initiation factor IF-3